MVGLIVAVVLAALCGALWAWMLIAAGDEVEPMPADQRVRDEWRSSGR